jgi:hypothetical protein
MYHTSTHPQTSAGEGMRAYGLSGIEFGHRTREYQVAAAHGLQLQEIQVRGRVNNFRQWLGDAMIRAGTGLAGDATRQVRRPAIRPKASMP